MTRQLISSGSSFEADIGYSRAVVDGDWVFVSGTTGFDYTTMTIADGLVEQTAETIGAFNQSCVKLHDLMCRMTSDADEVVTVRCLVSLGLMARVKRP